MKKIEKKAAAFAEALRNSDFVFRRQRRVRPGPVVSKLKAQGFRTIFAATGSWSGRKGLANFRRTRWLNTCFFWTRRQRNHDRFPSPYTSGKTLYFDCWQDLDAGILSRESDRITLSPSLLPEATFWIDEGILYNPVSQKRNPHCGICCSRNGLQKQIWIRLPRLRPEPDALGSLRNQSLL